MYGRPRRTMIDYNAPMQEFNREEVIPDDEATIILTNNGYIKRMPTKVYREQERGGKGIIAIELKEGDFVKQIISCKLKDYLFLLSNKGRAYWLKAYMVPEESRYGMGKALVNLVKLTDGERIRDVINTRDILGHVPELHNDKGQDKARQGGELLKAQGKRDKGDTPVPGRRARRRLPVRAAPTSCS